MRTRISEDEAKVIEETIEEAGGTALFLAVPSTLAHALSRIAEFDFELGVEVDGTTENLIGCYGNRYTSCDALEWYRFFEEGSIPYLLYSCSVDNLSPIEAQSVLCSTFWSVLDQGMDGGLVDLLKRVCTRSLCNRGLVKRESRSISLLNLKCNASLREYFDRDYACSIVDAAFNSYEENGISTAPEDKLLVAGAIYASHFPSSYVHSV